jgi:hypothetical protein
LFENVFNMWCIIPTINVWKPDNKNWFGHSKPSVINKNY